MHLRHRLLLKFKIMDQDGAAEIESNGQVENGR